MDSTQGKSRIWPWALAGLVGVYLAGFILFATSLPETPKTVEPADGIVTLTGGGARLDAAVNLLEHHAGKRLLISGVHSTTTKADLKRLSNGGARFDCCADLGFAAVDTHGNADETRDWVKRHGYRSIILVTASYHMRRSLIEFSTDMPSVKLEPYPVEPDGIDLSGWWHDPHALRLLQSEYAKYLLSLVMNSLGPPKDQAGRHHLT
ncbi:MAG: YdcF family protein [Proteobacteria bacterium]|nr:YdcF family protein [Pseudomonadota bacterium]